MSVWAGLIVQRVMALADAAVTTGVELDGILAAVETPRLEVAETLSQALAMNDIAVPDTDVALGKYLAARPVTKVPVNLNTRGLVLDLGDGRLGMSSGVGTAVESYGEGLCVIGAPEAGRYVAAFIIPGVTVLGGGA